MICALAVVVSPHGMRGKLTGCCPGDLVKQVYLRLFNYLISIPYLIHFFCKLLFFTVPLHHSLNILTFVTYCLDFFSLEISIYIRPLIYNCGYILFTFFHVCFCTALGSLETQMEL